MFDGITITKKGGGLVLIIDNEHLTLRLYFNHWTFEVKDFKYSIKQEQK
jgi:hypothetical protein